MSMSDPIADMLTRIRNGQAVSKASVRVPSSNVKKANAEAKAAKKELERLKREQASQANRASRYERMKGATWVSTRVSMSLTAAYCAAPGAIPP